MYCYANLLQVKADREEMGDSDKDTQTLQERTKDLPNQPKPSHSS